MGRTTRPRFRVSTLRRVGPSSLEPPRCLAAPFEAPALDWYDGIATVGLGPHAEGFPPTAPLRPSWEGAVAADRHTAIEYFGDLAASPYSTFLEQILRDATADSAVRRYLRAHPPVPPPAINFRDDLLPPPDAAERFSAEACTDLFRTWAIAAIIFRALYAPAPH